MGGKGERRRGLLWEQEHSHIVVQIICDCDLPNYQDGAKRIPCPCCVRYFLTRPTDLAETVYRIHGHLINANQPTCNIQSDILISCQLIKVHLQGHYRSVWWH